MRHLIRASTHGVQRAAITMLLIGGAIGSASCSDSTGTRAGTNQLGFTLANRTGATAALAALVPTTVGGHTLDLTAVTVTVGRAELKRTASTACEDENSDDDHGHDDANCSEAHTGPLSIDLPTDGSLVTVPANAIPAGTYREVEVRLSFIRFKGTFDGQAFDVTVQSNAKAEIEFATPLVVADASPTTVTVNLPVIAWLTNTDGSLVDPRTIATSQTVMAAVRQRIAASVRAFEDRDHDGKDDHGHDGHG